MILEKFSWPDNATVAFVIRDDDVSFFTNPDMLELIYRKAWRKRFKTTFAVIPFHKAVNNLNVPPTFRNKSRYFSISLNKKLVDYLKKKLVKGEVDIAQHGFSHCETHSKFLKTDSINNLKERSRVEVIPEFKGLNESACHERVKKGRKHLENLFEKRINVFVPPYEYLSKHLLLALKRERMFVCSSFNLRKVMSMSYSFIKPWKFLVSYLHKIRVGRWTLRQLFEITDPHLVAPLHRLSKHKHLSSSWLDEFKRKFHRCAEEKGFFILTTHYWQYFYDWKGEITQQLLLDQFYEILEYVDKYDVWKCSLTELCNYLCFKRPL